MILYVAQDRAYQARAKNSLGKGWSKCMGKQVRLGMSEAGLCVGGKQPGEAQECKRGEQLGESR